MNSKIRFIKNQIESVSIMVDLIERDLLSARAELKDVEENPTSIQDEINSAKERVEDLEAELATKEKELKKYKERLKKEIKKAKEDKAKPVIWQSIALVVAVIIIIVLLVIMLLPKSETIKESKAELTTAEQNTAHTKNEVLPAGTETDKTNSDNPNGPQVVVADDVPADDLETATGKFYAGGRPDNGVYQTSETNPASSLSETEKWLNENCVFEPGAEKAREYLLSVFDPTISANIIANDTVASDQTSVRGAKLMKNEVFCASIGDVTVKADKAKLKINVPGDEVVATVYVFGTETGRELEVSNFSTGAIGANLTTGDQRSTAWQLRWMVYPSFDKTVNSDLGGSKTENWIYIVDETNIVKVLKVVPEYYEITTGSDWKLKFVSYEELKLK